MSWNNLRNDSLAVAKIFDWGRVNSYLVRRLNQLSRCSRAEVELNTIEFDTTIARRLNRALVDVPSFVEQGQSMTFLKTGER